MGDQSDIYIIVVARIMLNLNLNHPIFYGYLLILRNYILWPFERISKQTTYGNA